LASARSFGSESLVGFHAVEALTSRHNTTLITAQGMERPSSIVWEKVAVQIDQPNDIAAWQLLWFELRQRNVIGRLLRSEHFDVVHRVTPSGLKDSLLPVPDVSLVLGPILLSEPHPPAFRAIFRPALPRRWSFNGAVRRVQHGIARRVFQRWSTLNQLLEHAALILVGTRPTLMQLPARLHSRCRLVTYAGVEHDVFRPARMKRQNRVPQLLFVGRVVSYKGVELLLRAAAAARKACRFELKIVGRAEPRYRRYCNRLVRELNLSECVEFIDAMPRGSLIELYQAADAFCMPSVETYGIAILEAMSSGSAVLVSDINGPGEIVQPGTGVKVPLETPEQFIAEYAEKIVALVENPGLRAELGAAAREHVVRHHDWNDIQAALLDIFDECFPGGSASKQVVSEPIAIA
jgi:glycosyltransferase involved in cell wall biosynthesis